MQQVEANIKPTDYAHGVGTIVRHRLTEEKVLIMDHIPPDSRDSRMDTKWYLVRCGLASKDTQLSKEDYSRRKFAQFELEPITPVVKQ